MGLRKKVKWIALSVFVGIVVGGIWMWCGQSSNEKEESVDEKTQVYKESEVYVVSAEVIGKGESSSEQLAEQIDGEVSDASESVQESMESIEVSETEPATVTSEAPTVTPSATPEVTAVTPSATPEAPTVTPSATPEATAVTPSATPEAPTVTPSATPEVTTVTPSTTPSVTTNPVPSIVPRPESCAHDFKKSIWENPTCMKGGYYNNICQKCGLVECVTLEALPHEPEEILIQEGNCMEDTVIQHICKNCGLQVKSDTRFTPQTHDWVSETIDGEELTYCSRCGVAQ